MLRVKFGGTYLADKDVSGLNGFTRTLIYESDRKVFRLKTETKLELIGNAFTFVYGEINKANCTKFDLIVEDDCSGNFESIFNGIVYSSDIFLDPNKCRATIETIKDNSYSAVIDALQDNSVNLYANFSPRCFEVDIEQFFVKYYDINGVALPNRKSYKWFDVLKFLVDYYSNGTIDFQTNVTEEIWVTNGYNLRAQSGDINLEYFEVNFFELFDNLSKLLNLAIVIEFDAFNKPILKVVYKSYLTNGGLIKTLTDDDVSFDFAISIDKSRQYNSIAFGSENFDLADEANDNWDDNDKFSTWHRHTVNTCSDCLSERGNELNLVANYIIDSDLIMETLGGDDSNDENIFLIEGIYSTNEGNLYGVPYLVNHYNRIFLNGEVLDRYSNEINCYTTSTLGGGDTMVADFASGSIQFTPSPSFLNLAFNPLELADNGNNADDTIIRFGGYPFDTAYCFIVPTAKKYQFIAKGKISASCIEPPNVLRSCQFKIKMWVVDAIDLPFVSPHINTYNNEQIINVFGNESEYSFSLDITENLSVGQHVFLTYESIGLYAGFATFKFNQFDFEYIDCVPEDMRTDSINDLPFLANFSFLQTQNEFNELVKTNKRYGYFRYKGSKLFISSIENNGCKSNGIFYCDKLPECT